ncbi:DUF3883 domain-containing protein [Microbacterium sp. CH1]|uniref:DUF3883 domain-containing protein n=1 Tax=Microbacterium sp. CH1 TaxID=1770208 RepID=UPI00078755C8|nr:DUF3883 domain-containing protein [Microbacterium sp. CH1]KYJ97042.1 hypothetical protein AUV07_04725 [Microbacterium sp. CH1]
MPIVLYTGEGPSRAGYVYDDRTGVSYEFPDRYLSMIQPGERFIYHRPGHYSGAGLIGPIRLSENASNSVCEILDYKQFDVQVPLRGPDDHYYEADPESGRFGVFWSQGVRRVSESAYERMIAAGWPDGTPGRDHATDTDGVPGYADAATALAVERYAVGIVLDLLHVEHPDVEVVEQARNNPGFDVRVGPAEDPVAFVEVKGTQAGEPVFWLTEGERKFSIANADRYELFVIAGIDLATPGAYRLHRRKGAVHGDGVTLEPSQWRGHLA